MTSPEVLSHWRCVGNAAHAVSLTKLASEGISESAIETASEVFDRVLQPGCGLRISESAGRCVALCTRIVDGSCGLQQQTEATADAIGRLTPATVSA